jgi:hypothetical protein
MSPVNMLLQLVGTGAGVVAHGTLQLRRCTLQLQRQTRPEGRPLPMARILRTQLAAPVHFRGQIDVVNITLTSANIYTINIIRVARHRRNVPVITTLPIDHTIVVAGTDVIDESQVGLGFWCQVIQVSLVDMQDEFGRGNS